MANRKWSRAAFALAPILALAACDQIGSLWERVTGHAPSEQAGPARLEDVPQEARAISGSLQSEDAMAALLAPEPVLVAPGQILVGAHVDAALPAAAASLGVASSLIRGLRAEGLDALNALPEEMQGQVRQLAEEQALESARAGAKIVLERLGVQGEIDVSTAGVVRIDLAPDSGASPTSFRFSQEAAAPAVVEEPQAIEWNAADRCPTIVSQTQLEDDVALATRCTIQRLIASRQFEYVEPNYIASNVMSWPPRRDKPPSQPAPSQPAPNSGAPPASSGSTATTSTHAPATTTTSTATIVTQGGMPNDPLLALQWDFRPRGTGAGQSPGGAGFTAYWDANQVGSRAVHVAVVDTGIDLTHPDIAGSPNVAPGIDLIANAERAGDGDGIDADPQDAGDKCGTASENSYHGTHVAGTIGAGVTNNRVGVAGAAWNITVVPVRVLGKCGGELADIVSGIRWAAGLAPAVNAAGQQIVNQNPADVINLSLSLQAPCPASMQAAIDAATQRGSVVVVAAGNKANQASLYAPANCNNVVVVGAEDARGGLAFYSNFGPEVDILAPGGDLFADSDNDGRPDGILSTRATQSGCYDPLNQSSTDKCYYSFLQGTSMAAPHVTAALALLAGETGARGQALQDMLFTRAAAPLDPTFGQIECARSRNAIPISAGSTTCARPSGRGALDMARAAADIHPPGSAPQPTG